MTGIQDWAQLGIFPLQDHEREVPTGMRRQIVGGRILKIEDPEFTSDPERSMTVIAAEEGMGTIGDVHPWFFWQTRARGRRDTGSWAQAWGGVYHDGSSPGSQSGGTVAGGGGGGLGVRPIRNDSYNADLRYAPKPILPPAGFPYYPRGHMVMVVPGTDEEQQFNLALSADGRLYAPQTAGPGACGTLVVDLQPDNQPCMDAAEDPGVGGRAARLQSILRVIAMPPNSSAGFLSSAGNSLALNWSLSQQDGIAGYGLIFAQAASGGTVTGPTTGGPGGTITGPTTPGSGGGTVAAAINGGAVETLGALGAADDDTLGKSPYEFGKFRPRALQAHAVACMAHLPMFGPIHPGSVTDKHRIGVDRDGHPINSAHIATGAFFFRDAEFDGPLLFEGRYPNPPPMPLISRVHLSWDGNLQHPTVAGAAAGYWRWWAEVPFLSPPTGGGNPPNGPPTGGPPTPGTPSGPAAPGPTTPGPGAPSGPGPGGPGPTAPATGGPGPGRGKSGPATPRPPRPGQAPSDAWVAYQGTPGRGPTTGGSPTPPQPNQAWLDAYGPGAAPGVRGPAAPRGPVSPRPAAPPEANPAYPFTPQPGRKLAKILKQVGETSLADQSLYVIHHPIMESFASVSFRPQLMVRGYPSFEHDAELNGDEARLDEESRPQVLVVRAWGAQGNGDWTYVDDPDNSRARGGTARGGILFGPPGLELEDYMGLGDGNPLAPTTASVVAVAPGVSFGLGTPHSDGGLAATGVTIAQGNDANQTLTIAQLDSTRTSRPLVTGKVDQGTGEISVATGGTAALKIPRGTTGQRPTSFAPAGGEIRINSSGANDVLEFWDAQGSTWTTAASSGSGVSDHGLLTGLADDDHTQYSLVTGTRAFTGPVGALAAGTIPEHFIRGVELSASQSAQDAVILLLLGGKSDIGHTHAASDIVSGTVATARLGSGTANSTTYLRGDGTWATVSGGSLSDGDKGDITVSASGATWTIDAGAVTLAKMENVAAGRVLGRKISDGTGPPQHMTAGETRSAIGLGALAVENTLDISLITWGGFTNSLLSCDGDGITSVVGISDFATASHTHVFDAIAAPFAQSQDSFELATDFGRILTKRMTLTGTRRATLRGTSRLRIT